VPSGLGPLVRPSNRRSGGSRGAPKDADSRAKPTDAGAREARHAGTDQRRPRSGGDRIGRAPRPRRGPPDVTGPLGGACLIPRPLGVVGYSCSCGPVKKTAVGGKAFRGRGNPDAMGNQRKKKPRPCEGSHGGAFVTGSTPPIASGVIGLYRGQVGPQKSNHYLKSSSRARADILSIRWSAPPFASARSGRKDALLPHYISHTQSQGAVRDAAGAASSGAEDAVCVSSISC
jgi:hypothetical protein